MSILRKTTILLLVFAITSVAQAAVYKLGPIGDDVIGEVGTVVVKEGENFATIAHSFDLGFYELVEANPGVDAEKVPAGTVLIIPTRYILPNTAREAAVINLAEMRLYYYPKGTNEVWTFPVGIGREGSQTPNGYMKIIERLEHPT
jgi:L,D-transpeptidase ErfK/SrfK